MLGGLRPGTITVMSEKQKAFLRHHWEEIHQLTGQPFGYEILERNDFVYDTEPAARAVVVVQQLQALLAFDFFKAIQAAFYVKGRDTNVLETYLELCDDFFIDRAVFATLFEQEAIRIQTEANFEQARMLGVMGFPTVLLRQGQTHKLLARGYDSAENMAARLEHWRIKWEI
ncbi:MAG: hypothetical protein OHK0053_05580 [Microscillaceae bacterium]